MASIKARETKRGPRYDVRYRTPDGRVRTETFTTEKLARARANIVEADKYRGTFVDPHAGRATFREYAGEWLAHRPGLRPRTRRRTSRS